MTLSPEDKPINHQLISSLQSAELGIELTLLLMKAAENKLKLAEGGLDLKTLPQIIELATTFQIKPSDLLEIDDSEAVALFEKMYGQSALEFMREVFAAEKQGVLTSEVIKQIAIKHGLSSQQR